MPIITYEIQRNIQISWRGRKFWRTVKECFDVEVSDAVAKFLARDNGREKRYQDKIRKQIKAAKIRELFSLNDTEEDIFQGGAEYELEEVTEDIVHRENRTPLSILIEREDAEILNRFYTDIMTSKQYDAFRLHDAGYNKTEIAGILKIDESSARERLEVALIIAVEFYLAHSNLDILKGLNDFIFNDKQGKMAKTKYANMIGTTFRKLIYLIRPDQREIINYIVNGEHKKEIKKYLDLSEQTPEKGT